MPKVLVIIVTYNGMRWLDRCLQSLRNSGQAVDVLVVDNGSSDGSCEYIRSNFPEVELVCRRDNPGFGASNNIGLRLVLERGYDFAYLLNQDAWVDQGTIGGLISVWNPEYAIISPVQTTASGKFDRNFARKCERYLSSDSPLCEVPFVMAAHWLLSAGAIRKIGGFSPAFKQYGEDDNYIDRAHFFGFKVGVATSFSAVHDRESREDDRNKRMRLKCISAVVKLSDPSCIPLLRKLKVFLELLGMSAKNLSSEPLRFLPELKKRIAELDALRLESRNEKAFL